MVAPSSSFSFQTLRLLEVPPFLADDINWLHSMNGPAFNKSLHQLFVPHIKCRHVCMYASQYACSYSHYDINIVEIVITIMSVTAIIVNIIPISCIVGIIAVVVIVADI